MSTLQKASCVMMRLMARVMPSCRDISALISEAMDHQLPWRQRMSIRLHVSLCHLCRRYQKQLHLLHHGFRAYADPEQNPTEKSLSPEAKTRLDKALADKAK